MDNVLTLPHPASFVVAGVVAVGTAALLRRRSGLRRGRRLALIAGAAIFAVAVVGPLDAWGEQAGLAVHVFQHLLIFSAAASLIVVGASGLRSEPRTDQSGFPAAMGIRAATICLVAGVGVLWLLHIGPVLAWAIESPTANDLQHLALLAAGVLVALPLAGPRALAGFGAAIYLVATEVTVGALGIVLAWSPALLYTESVYGSNPWGLSPLTDQALAGALILVLEEPLLAVEFAVVFIAGLRESERRQAAEDAVDAS